MHLQEIIVPSNITRIVAIGDAHGCLDGVKKIIEKEQDDNSVVLCVGDVVGYADGPTSSEMCDYLEQEKILSIMGNHEDWLDSDGKLAFVTNKYADKKLSFTARRWISKLPEKIRFLDENKKIIADVVHCLHTKKDSWHFLDENNYEFFHSFNGSPRVIFTGHSHRPKIVQFTPKAVVTSFNFVDDDVLTMGISCPTMVDTGSSGRPEILTADGKSVRSNEHSTYGVFDLVHDTVSLHRVLR